jgi:hypothetical protein
MDFFVFGGGNAHYLFIASGKGAEIPETAQRCDGGNRAFLLDQLVGVCDPLVF